MSDEDELRQSAAQDAWNESKHRRNPPNPTKREDDEHRERLIRCALAVVEDTATRWKMKGETMPEEWPERELGYLKARRKLFKLLGIQLTQRERQRLKQLERGEA
jgi:hypothetical protein